MKTLITILAAFLVSAVFADNPKWKSGARVQETSVGYIALSDEGNEDFAAVVEAQLRKGLSIQHVYLARSWIGNRVLQEQLLTIIRKNAPNELDGAIRSAGNMHNPKVIALRPAVCRAFLQTGFVGALDRVLGDHNLQITEVSIEKLMVTHADGWQLIDGIVWLLVAKKDGANQTPHPTPL